MPPRTMGEATYLYTMLPTHHGIHRVHHPSGYTYPTSLTAVVHAADMPQDELTALEHEVTVLNIAERRVTVLPTSGREEEKRSNDAKSGHHPRVFFGVYYFILRNVRKASLPSSFFFRNVRNVHILRLRVEPQVDVHPQNSGDSPTNLTVCQKLSTYEPTSGWIFLS